jgi:myo-inositol-1(or 4)-monophosphatase
LENVDINFLVREVIALAEEVAGFIRQEARSFDRSRTEAKGKNDLVSYVDKEAEAKIVARLLDLLPGAGFIAEEGTGEEVPGGYNWIIDPLDGTTNFIHGLPIYAVSIALAKGNEVLLGVVYEVSSQECFHALRGGGAFLNGAPIRVSAINTLADSLVATGFPYRIDEIDSYMGLLKAFLTKTHGFRRIGSAAVDLAYVAAGRFEAFYEKNLNAWDVAAGVLLVAEAGGRVSDFRDGDNFIFGRELVASGQPQVHAELLAIVREHFGQN